MASQDGMADEMCRGCKDMQELRANGDEMCPGCKALQERCDGYRQRVANLHHALYAERRQRVWGGRMGHGLGANGLGSKIPWSMVHGPWSMVHGPWSMEQVCCLAFNVKEGRPQRSQGPYGHSPGNMQWAIVNIYIYIYTHNITYII